MITASGLRKEVDEFLRNGEKVRIKYYTVSGATTGYDDNVALTKSGTDYYTSGLVQPLNNNPFSNDAQLVQQGRLLTDEKKIYLNGQVQTSGVFKIGIGSPNFQEYAVNDMGVKHHNINGELVYKKAYIRYLTTGSLLGES